MRIYHTARSRICVIPNWLLQLASVWNTIICHQKAATCAKLGCPCCHAFVKDADAEEIALAACEVSHNIQSGAGYIQGTARHGTKLLENYAAKLHAFSLTDIRDWKFTHHAESTPQIRVPYFRLCGSQVVERTIPVNIRTTTSLVSFRSSLKTLLFKLAYAWLVSSVSTCFTNCSFYLIYNYTFFIVTWTHIFLNFILISSVVKRNWPIALIGFYGAVYIKMIIIYYYIVYSDHRNTSARSHSESALGRVKRRTGCLWVRVKCGEGWKSMYTHVRS